MDSYTYNKELTGDYRCCCSMCLRGYAREEEWRSREVQQKNNKELLEEFKNRVQKANGDDDDNE